MKLGKATPPLNPFPLFIPKSATRESGGTAVEMFNGLMQLGEAHSGMGRSKEAISCYGSALRIQIEALGDSDPRALHTYRYLAEAHMEGTQLDEAEDLCRKMIHGTHIAEEETHYRLSALRDYESALECLAMANGAEMMDVSMGNMYLCLGRLEDAVFGYQKALSGLRSAHGHDHDHPSVASVLLRLADLHHRTGMLGESRVCCEEALRIYAGPTGGTDEEVASGLSQISAVYESLGEPEEALGLLRGARDLLAASGTHQGTVGGLEAQMGVMLYVAGRYTEACAAFESALSRLHQNDDGESPFFAIVLNQAGLACLHLYRLGDAARLFQAAREIMDRRCGPSHFDTLGVCSNLAATYDAMGRVEEAIEILEYIVTAREEKLGTENPDVDVVELKRRLGQLLREAGRSPPTNPTSLRSLLASQHTLGNKVKAKKKKKKNKWPGFSFKN